MRIQLTSAKPNIKEIWNISFHQVYFLELYRVIFHENFIFYIKMGLFLEELISI